MAIEIGELRAILSLSDQFSGPINAASKNLGGFKESFGAVTQFAGLAVGAIGAATGAIVALGQRGAVVDDVQQAFGGLSRAAGSSASVMLGELQTATLGTISNFDLMAMANKAMGSGLIKSSGDMAALAGGAKLLADRTGGDTSEAFQKLTDAMAKGKVGALKQLGIFVDSSSAAEKYAASLGKSVKDLTDQEKATALSSAGLAALKAELDKNGPAVRDFGDLIDVGKVAVQNFTDNLGVAIARSPVVRAGLEAITGAVQSAFGGDQQETIKTLMGLVNRFAIFLVDAAQVGVEAARFITNAFSGAKVIFNLVLEALFSGVAKAGEVLADLAAKATTLPVVGSLFVGMAKTMREGADQANSLAIGFGEMKDKALDSAAAQNAALDAVQGALGRTEEAMRAALNAEVDLTTRAEALATGLAETGTAAGLTAAQITAMEEATRTGQEALFDLAAMGAEKFKELQEEITLANMTGLARRLADIDLAREREIAGVQALAFMYPELYAGIVAKVQEAFGLQTAAAVQSFADQAAAAVGAGATTIDQAEKNLANAKKVYAEMLASGKATYAQLQAAKEQVDKAEEDLDKNRLEEKLANFATVASAGADILRTLFGKSKTAAIAAAILDTFSAVAKTLSAYPWPWSLAPAAAAYAAGMAQVYKIKNTEAGFAQGTPGTQFMDFGRGSMETLHGPEAVVTMAQGASVAGMVRDALEERQNAGSDPAMLEKLDAIDRSLTTALPKLIGRAVRDAVLQVA